jgi:hypothetical protein
MVSENSLAHLDLRLLAMTLEITTHLARITAPHVIADVAGNTVSCATDIIGTGPSYARGVRGWAVFTTACWAFISVTWRDAAHLFASTRIALFAAPRTAVNGIPIGALASMSASRMHRHHENNHGADDKLER